MQLNDSKLGYISIAKCLYFILFLLINLFLILNDLLWIALLVILLMGFTWLVSSIIFSRTLLPEISIKEWFTLLLIKLRIKDSHVVKVINGKVNNEIQGSSPIKKTKILIIDHSSAAIILHANEEHTLCTHGFYFFLRPVSLLCTFSTSPMHVVLGPSSASDLQNIRAGERLSDFHVRTNAARKTRYVTKEDRVIFPKIEVFYRFNLIAKKEILNLVQHLYNESVTQSIFNLSKAMHGFLLHSAMKECEKWFDQKTAAQIGMQVPMKLRLEEGTMNAFTYQAYISEVFFEDDIEEES